MVADLPDRHGGRRDVCRQSACDRSHLADLLSGDLTTFPSNPVRHVQPCVGREMKSGEPCELRAGLPAGAGLGSICNFPSGLALQTLGPLVGPNETPGLESSPRPGLTLVGNTGIEPVTSTVSRCRTIVLTIELPALSWAAAVGLSPGFPALTSVSTPFVGTLWGQPWGQLWTATCRADEDTRS